MSISRIVPVESETFEEMGYLTANPDVAAAVRSGVLTSGRTHFELFGHKEGRSQTNLAALQRSRAEKLSRYEHLLRKDMQHQRRGDKFDFLTDELRAATRIVDTANVSENAYDRDMVSLIEKHPDGIILDCGSGRRGTVYDNVLNFEIVDYETTDVLGVGEDLPFVDNAFDVVFSVAVLEHVRDPFQCAREIGRVLKPGGQLYCSVPFLQPFHGYPHHYFNCTSQGIRRLFEDLDVQSVSVPDSTHPIWSLTWILNSWLRGLPKHDQDAFRKLTVEQLCGPPASYLGAPFCRNLSESARMELASATVLKATKN